MKRRRARMLLVIVLSLPAVVVTPSANAIELYPHAREGFFIGSGLGWGNAGADLTVIENAGRHNGGTGNVRFGWALRDEIVAGLEFSGWASNLGGNRWVFTLSGLAVTVWPANQGFYLRPTIGIGTARVEIGQGGGTRQDQAGAGYALATGYEWRVQRNAAIGPQFEIAFLDIGGELTRTAHFLSLSIQLTGYW